MPGSAVFRRGEVWSVFVIAEGRARLRKVELGHRTPFEVEILGGVDEGAMVIRNPTDRIEDGSRVRTAR